MGRPRVHDERTAGALLEVAEQIAEAEGWQALSARRIAEAAGTTTRAVYAGYGSMAGIVTALGTKGFELLHDYVAAAPLTDDPVADVVAAGAEGFRGWVRDHRALFEVSVLRPNIPQQVWQPTRLAAQRAWAPLHARMQRLPEGHLRGRSLALAGLEYHVCCEGLASVDLRQNVSEANPGVWTDTLRALVLGWAQADPGE